MSSTLTDLQAEVETLQALIGRSQRALIKAEQLIYRLRAQSGLDPVAPAADGSGPVRPAVPAMPAP